MLSDYGVELLATISGYIACVLLLRVCLVFQALSGAGALDLPLGATGLLQDALLHSRNAAHVPVGFRQGEQQKQCAEEKEQITLHVWFEK